MDTGVVPLDGDFDIDQGIYFAVATVLHVKSRGIRCASRHSLILIAKKSWDRWENPPSY